MLINLQRFSPWVAAWLMATLAGGVLLARAELGTLRESFETDARIAHRLLSQRAVQHDAVLATLALLGGSDVQSRPEARLPSVYPQVLAVQRRDRDFQWVDSGVQTHESQSRQLRRAVLGHTDLKNGRFDIVLGADPTSYLLKIDVRSMVPWNEWPMDPATSPVRVILELGDQQFVVQAGSAVAPSASGWLFDFHKTLAADSQPLNLIAQRQVGWNKLPWVWMMGWSLMAALALASAQAVLRQRQARQRAEELLRLGQVARLNSLGELAAGMAHELNQPLTAVLANTQAASRLLAEDQPDLETSRLAIKQAVDQARRASAVVGRLRRSVERPTIGAELESINLLDTTRKALYLLEPTFKQHGLSPQVTVSGPAFKVLADPVGLEQVIHNLLMNALQALDQVPAQERSLLLVIRSTASEGTLTLEDSGPGIPTAVLARIFEPFFTTREGGLGLGLSLCETLVSTMGGTLTASNRGTRGAVFELRLPLARNASPQAGKP
jgi:signal transduction histidine kinase